MNDDSLPPGLVNPITFRGQLEHLINCHNKEAGSNTPDFILAEYLEDCLAAFDKAAKRREKWYCSDKPQCEPPAGSNEAIARHVGDYRAEDFPETEGME